MRTLYSAIFILSTACGTESASEPVAAPRAAAAGHTVHRVAQTKAEPPPDVLALTTDSSCSMSDDIARTARTAGSGRVGIWDNDDVLVAIVDLDEIGNLRDGRPIGVGKAIFAEDDFNLHIYDTDIILVAYDASFDGFVTASLHGRGGSSIANAEENNFLHLGAYNTRDEEDDTGLSEDTGVAEE